MCVCASYLRTETECSQYVTKSLQQACGGSTMHVDGNTVSAASVNVDNTNPPHHMVELTWSLRSTDRKWYHRTHYTALGLINLPSAYHDQPPRSPTCTHSHQPSCIFNLVNLFHFGDLLVQPSQPKHQIYSGN